MRRATMALMMALAATLVTACGEQQPPTVQIREDSYTVRGEVESVSAGEPVELLIRHEAVGDFKDLLTGEVVGMKAMTMPFTVENASMAEQVQPGDKVRFTFKTTRSGPVITEVQSLPADTELNFTAETQPSGTMPAHDDHAGHNH